MSQEPSSFNFSTANEFRPIRSAAMRAVSSALSTPTPLIFNCISCPWSSTCGARPGENIRSLVFGAACSMEAMILAVGAVPGKSGTAAAGAETFEASMPDPPPSRPGGNRHVLGQRLHYEAPGTARGGPESTPVLKRLAVLHGGRAGKTRAWRCFTRLPGLNEQVQTGRYPILFPYTCPSLRTAEHASLLLYTLRIWPIQTLQNRLSLGGALRRQTCLRGR